MPQWREKADGAAYSGEAFRHIGAAASIESKTAIRRFWYQGKARQARPQEEES